MVSVDALTLRSYQTQLLQNVFSAFAQGKRCVFLQLPTGGGKTHCFSHLAREFLNQQQGVLVIAHRKELIEQAHNKLTAISGLPAAKITAGKKVDPTYQLHIASIQTIRNRKHKPEAGIVIIDEAHHATSKSYSNLITAYPNAYILGVSATPMRCDGGALNRYFDELITGPSVRELINQGYLCPFRLFGASHQISTDNIKITGGDYNKKQLQKVVEEQIVCTDVKETWQKYASGKQTVIFNVSVSYSQHLAQTFNDAGIPAAHIDGGTPRAQRESLIQQFRDQKIRILCNCEIVTEGFDVPGMEAVQIVRPTRSLILWLQMVGRVLRPFPGKETALIIDHTDNWKRLGLPDDNYQWSLHPISLPKSEHALQCGECHHVFKPQPHERKIPTKVGINRLTGELREIYQAQCPHCLRPVDFECRHENDGGGLRLLNQDDNLEIREIPPGTQGWAILHFENLVAIQQQAGYKPGWLHYKLEESPLYPYFSIRTWLWFAQKLGYKRRWAHHQYQQAQGWKTRNMPLLFDEQEILDAPAPPRPPQLVMTEAQDWIQSLQRMGATRQRKRQNPSSQPDSCEPKSLAIHYLYQCSPAQKAYIDIVGTTNQGQQHSVMVQGESYQRLRACCHQIEPNIYKIREDIPTYIKLTRKEKTPSSMLHHGTITIGSQVREMTLMHSRKQFEPELVIGNQQSPD